ncbi:hypothetical protein CJO79_23430 (plasmid) [Ralstonia solanacearum]|nr:hypothetical protein CJO76_23450 [Ralstonia solanacearum]AXV94099.1 hypothetical protein CJO79_23430 [Ralstonia solanacearum]AXW22101.1 hypothetical protein CJO85_23555 [Ralstonia solanacearum]AXW78997.1 hypothetical protein CJO97_23430 [Ralstonia solanacearum]
MLQLLDSWSARSSECRSLHCLLGSLKLELDSALHNVQKML